MTDTWLNLAAMMGPCPECHGQGHLPSTSDSPRHLCPTCNGTGQVPLIPGLRYSCVSDPHTHNGVACKGWWPHSGPEAIVAAQEYILSQRSENCWWNFEAERSDDGIIVSISNEWEQLGMSDPQSTYEPALAQALERAVEEKHG